MSKLLLIVPTKGRPDKHLEFYESFKINSTMTDLVFVLSHGDVDYPRIPGVKYETVDSPTMSGKLNNIAVKYANDYDYIAFMGDDVRIRTNAWDAKMLDGISSVRNAIAYGNDLYQGENLPTAVLMDTNIIKTLGFMSPPDFKHLYIDNYWKSLGTRLLSLKYFSEIILEHLHFTIGKAVEDDTYRESSSQEAFLEDRDAYNNYILNKLENDVAKLIYLPS
jgi:hypothetical protein